MRYSDKIGRHIRSIRESKGFSQDYVAQMLDISQSAYACMESGRTSMHIERLFRIGEILEVDMKHLLLIVGRQDDGNDTSPGAGGPILAMEMKGMYDQLISELRSEIHFLRSLVLSLEEKK